MKQLLIAIILVVGGLLPAKADSDYKDSPAYLALRDSMHHAFNDGDSARFFPALSRLEDYLLKQNDLHAYYTQRCNEIVFQMNRQRIMEAYKLARQLSQELREKKLDDEMYMAYNMLGHLNRYCGNKESAKRLFRKVIEMMEKAGYYESMPPIYMNIVNVELDDDPEEAQRMLDKAIELSVKYAPDRVFDIETRKTLSYFNGGDIPRFLEGYKKYKEGVAEGKSSVHGRTVEVYYEACMGNTDKAVQMAHDELGEESYQAATKIYEMGGRWKEAFESLRKASDANDSITNVVLMNSMEGFQNELRSYDTERKAARARTIGMGVIIVLLLLLIAALGYIMFSHRRHMRQLKRAYDHALESDKLKAAFMQNMSHEVRTPLNVISGFAQVMANPELSNDEERRKDMAQLMLKNTRIITNQIDAMLELSMNEASGTAPKDDSVLVNHLMKELLREKKVDAAEGVDLKLNSQLDDNYSIKTNQNMVKRMVNALLDNAIKYTSKGQILLKTSVDDTTWTIAVEDTGCGIPADKVGHIFERFYKVDSFKSGLGLGLPLCKKMAERLGGTVNYDTTYTNGARFVVTLPL